MALLHCDFFSSALEMGTSMCVILPQPCDRGLTAAQMPPQGPPCLLLLHGRSDDHTGWVRRTSIERYAAALGLAVVMPAVQRSYYTDMAFGLRYWSFIADELPEILSGFFKLSPRREDNLVAGLSMGGYGAFKLALHRPERFAAAISLSGALDVAGRPEYADTPAGRQGEGRHIFGDAPLRGSDADLLACARRAAERGTALPALYQWCGTEDFLYTDNLAFRDEAKRLNIPLTYTEGPGDHTWAHWDREIERALAWFWRTRRGAHA